jgi:hypothetical protein
MYCPARWLTFQQLRHILADAFFQFAGFGVVRYLIRAHRLIRLSTLFHDLKAVGFAVARWD